jgi:pantoate--beta-alanine ligase
MVTDLNMPLEIVVCPIVRDDDGLAVSSRNKYLSDQERQDATSLYKGLQKARELIQSGVTDCRQILADLKTIIEAPPSISLEYANIVNSRTLEDLANVQGQVLIAVAARAGATRLIDNILVDVSLQTDTMGQ